MKLEQVTFLLSDSSSNCIFHLNAHRKLHQVLGKMKLVEIVPCMSSAKCKHVNC